MDDMISSDSHIIEPPDLWTERVDARFRDRAPRIVREDDGDFWYIDGQRSMSFLGVQTGDRFEIAGQGVPYLRRAGRGKLLVTAFVMTPDRLSREQRELLEQLRATLPDSGVVARDGDPGLWQRLRGKFR